ncbi:MAG: ABC transporter substrate-binding protein, partial [Lachnospiraceae bacterium]|nr:ABC transporter substrate-binding protein [Lachnospiraceae bacterium]
MKRILATLLSLCMVASLAACGSSDSSTETTAAADAATETTAAAEAESGDESGSADTSAESVTADKITIEISSSVSSFHPYATATTNSYRIANAEIYQPLFRQYGYGVEMEDWEGVIADSIEYDSETMTYTIHLKEGVYDSAGNPFTASDVVFSFQTQYAVNPDAVTYWTHADIDSLTVVDDYTVTLSFFDATPGIINTLMLRTNMVTQAAYEAAGSDGDGMITQPVGTGPYVLSEYVDGVSYTLTATENYWNAGNGEQNVNTIVYTVITESAQRGINFETGDVDVLYDVSSSDYSRLSADTEIAQVIEEPDNSIVLLGFNCTDASPCSEVLLRQAIAYAIDTEAIALTAYDGLAEACYTFGASMWLDWNDEYASDGIYYAVDMDKAAELFAESGNSEGLELTLAIEDNSQLLMAATIIQQSLSEIGITLTIDQYDSSSYSNIYMEYDSYDMYIATARSDNYATNIFNNFLNMNNSTGTRVGIEDETLQSLIEPYATGEMTQDEFDALIEYYNTIIPY